MITTCSMIAQLFRYHDCGVNWARLKDRSQWLMKMQVLGGKFWKLFWSNLRWPVYTNALLLHYMYTQNFSDPKSNWKVKLVSAIVRLAKRNKLSKKYNFHLISFPEATILMAAITIGSILAALSRARFPNSGWKSSIQSSLTQTARDLGARLSYIIKMLLVLSPYQISYLAKN